MPVVEQTLWGALAVALAKRCLLGTHNSEVGCWMHNLGQMDSVPGDDAAFLCHEIFPWCVFSEIAESGGASLLNLSQVLNF